MTMNSPSNNPRPVPETPGAGSPAGSAQSSSGTSGVTEAKIWEVLRTCYDPEIPINIVDLGLIYDVALQGGRVDVKMTLTAPGCHMGAQIAGNVQSQLLALDAVKEANVELVWDPPWHQSMITAEGRRILGLE